MSLRFGDVAGSLSERGLNRLIEHVRRQRPLLFNYACANVDRDTLCVKIDAAPEVIAAGDPLTTDVPEISPPGLYAPKFYIPWCLQIVQAAVDFYPKNVLDPLPPELKPLNPEQFAIGFDFHVGFGDPRMEPDAVAPGKDPIPGLAPIRFCFNLKLYLKCTVQFEANSGLDEIRFHLITPTDTPTGLRIDSVEFVDIEPLNLERGIELILYHTLQFGVLPRIKIALAKLVREIGNGAQIRFERPSGPDPNPAVRQDRLTLNLNIRIAETTA